MPDEARDPTLTSLSARIEAAVKALDRDGLLDLAMGLCDVASPTGHEEEAASFYHEHMRAAGLRSTLQPFAPGRATALGLLEGSDGGQTLMFIGHLDTFYPEPHKAGIVDDEWVTGAGMSNMKGAMAAYLAAVSAVRTASIPLDGDVLIAASAGGMQKAPVDEFQDERHRGYAVGTQHMLVRGAVADMCVLGEPTSFEIVTQHFGQQQVKISLDMDDPGRAATFFGALDEWVADHQRRNTTAGIVPKVVMLGIRGGRGWDADQSDLRETAIYLRIETPPRERPIAIKHAIRAFLEMANERDRLLGASAEIYATNSGDHIPDDSPVVTTVQAAHRNTFGEEARISAVNWHSDSTHLNRYGIPTVNYGASRRRGQGIPEVDDLHVDDLVDMARVYIDLIVRVCGAGAR